MRKVLIAVAVLASATSCAVPEQPPRSEPAPARPSPLTSEAKSPGGPRGEVAPDFTVTTFDGERFSLAEQRGTPVVLNFWESW